VKNSFDRKIMGGFALALALLLGIEALLYNSTAKQAETARLVARTHEVLAGIQELILRLTDAETARRGFIMTSQNRYLTHYSNAVERVSRVFSHLRTLTRDDPRQQLACAALDPLIRDRFEIYDQSIRGQVNEANPERQVTLTEAGQKIMEEIRTLIGQMEKAEKDVRSSRQAAAEANFLETRRFALVGSAASVTMLGLVFFLLIRENARRQLAEVALQKANEELERRVSQRTAEVTEALAGYQRAEEEIKKLNEELEQRVVERTAQLEAANKELEGFSYAVAHDLRAPLRAIHSFSHILLDDYAPHLDAEAQGYLQLVSANALHVGQQIDTLLEFASLSRRALAKQTVAPTPLVQQVLDELRPTYEHRQVEIVIGDLPTCQADPLLLTQVWANLLENALKFTRGRAVAHIEVGCYDRQGEQVYFVRDNGVGFEMQYVAKLFGVFQRLHRVEDYEGTGVGLALTQRIVQRHGGRIWAEAAMDQGATVYFALGE